MPLFLVAKCGQNIKTATSKRSPNYLKSLTLFFFTCFLTTQLLRPIQYPNLLLKALGAFMKSLALFTFSCFVMVSAARIYALNTTQKIQGRIVHNKQVQKDFFSQPATELIQGLAQLEDVIDKPEREKVQLQENSLLLEDIAELRAEFEAAVFEPEDNLVLLLDIQNQIKRKLSQAQTEGNLTDELDIFALFYFLIHERMDFQTLNESKGTNEILSKREQDQVNEYIQTDQFYREIFDFKNIPLANQEIEAFKRSIASIEESETEVNIFEEYIKKKEGDALTIEEYVHGGIIDEQMVRAKLERIHYNEEQADEYIHGYADTNERY